MRGGTPILDLFKKKTAKEFTHNSIAKAVIKYRKKGKATMPTF